MQTRQLGNSDLRITPLGVGAWAMGGAGWAFSWGPQDDQESIGAIHAALDRGINWIDTAAVYGLGHSEEVVGRAVKGRSNRPYVFTKCERIWNEQGQIQKSLERESIRHEIHRPLLVRLAKAGHWHSGPRHVLALQPAHRQALLAVNPVQPLMVHFVPTSLQQHP